MIIEMKWEQTEFVNGHKKRRLKEREQRINTLFHILDSTGRRRFAQSKIDGRRRATKLRGCG